MKYLKLFILASLTIMLISSNVISQDSKNRKQRIRRMKNDDDGAPKVGELAPRIKLKSLDGKEEWDLSSFKGEKPVVVFFGSYT